MNSLVLYQDHNNIIIWEAGEINSYTKAIFGQGWVFCKHLLFSISLERAKEIKEEIKKQAAFN